MTDFDLLAFFEVLHSKKPPICWICRYVQFKNTKPESENQIYRCLLRWQMFLMSLRTFF